MHRKLRLGMIGGGHGAFIGAVHRIAARMDNEYDLVCGSFSSNPQVSASSGKDLGIAEPRVYATYQQLFETEKTLPADIRVEVISIVTPNHAHFEPAKLAMENGFHVVMDKPITLTLAEARELERISADTGMLFCLTHTYTGYPMVKEARQIIISGKLGEVRKVYVEYPQGWLSTPLENTGQKQAEWRSDPKRNGPGGALGDIGTHAFNMAEYISGLKVRQLCADINKVVTGRQLDDDANVLLKFDNGASGILFATQIAAGEENNIKVRVYAENGGLEWQQNDANTLTIKWLDKPAEILRAGGNVTYLSSFALHNCRTPGGHPEGYLEAFANHYRNFALTIKAKQAREKAAPEWLDYPGIEEGVRGMAFIETAIASGLSANKWLELKL
ncbi:MAG: Gfo/Idh/MocA family oxidoreductase [Pyrinomonadaceae bacterium]|nr:Gfo/Idh/MocA family oxidoreductase [Sphingobacteriaceae bacterium]